MVKFSIFNLFPVNIIDLIFIVLILYFALTAKGLIWSIIDFLIFFLSAFFSFRYYPDMAKLFSFYFHTNNLIIKPVALTLLWLFSNLILSALASYIYKKIPKKIKTNLINQILGVSTNILQAGLFYLFLLTLIISLPTHPRIKKYITQSTVGKYTITLSQRFEFTIRDIFKEPIIQTINFLTIKPHSEESLSLGISLPKNELKINRSAEKTMFYLINQERQKRGLNPLILDIYLTKAARDYGLIMFNQGFFSHYSLVDQSTPLERITRYTNDFTLAAENLAFAPDVTIAHQGLINSKGHRENILHPDFKKVGIGVIDSGIYGKIFVQEFTD